MRKRNNTNKITKEKQLKKLRRFKATRRSLNILRAHRRYENSPKRKRTKDVETQ